MTADGGNIAHRNLNNYTGRGNNHDFMIVVYSLYTDEISGFLGNLVTFHSLTATMLDIEFFQSGSLTDTALGNNK